MMLIKAKSDKYIQQLLVVSEDIIATASKRKGQMKLAKGFKRFVRNFLLRRLGSALLSCS